MTKLSELPIGTSFYVRGGHWEGEIQKRSGKLGVYVKERKDFIEFNEQNNDVKLDIEIYKQGG